MPLPRAAPALFTIAKTFVSSDSDLEITPIRVSDTDEVEGEVPAAGALPATDPSAAPTGSPAKPQSEVDPFGGVIITDWYANPDMPTERFKLTVYILDTRLRADALAVNVFRQVRDETGGWIDAQAAAQTSVEIENAILTRARQLRIAQLDD